MTRAKAAHFLLSLYCRGVRSQDDTTDSFLSYDISVVEVCEILKCSEYSTLRE